MKIINTACALALAALLSTPALSAQEGAKKGTFDGTATVVNARNLPIPVTVAIDPDGGTAKVEVSTTDNAVEDPGNAATIWLDWDPGTVAAKTASAITSRVTAIRFTRVSGTNPCRYNILY